MSLARGWAPWTLAPLALAALALLAATLYPHFLVAAVGLLALALGAALFFRDPDRQVGEGIVAAADGRVRLVEGDRVATFLNLHNVHVIRAPYAGRVLEVERFSGGHVPAFLGGAKHNAGVSVTIETRWGPLTVKLIAGLIARRAIAWVVAGETVDKGQRIGMIRFGSRVDQELPPGAGPQVRPGQRVKAGETTVASEPGERA